MQYSPGSAACTFGSDHMIFIDFFASPKIDCKHDNHRAFSAFCNINAKARIFLFLGRLNSKWQFTCLSCACLPNNWYLQGLYENEDIGSVVITISLNDNKTILFVALQLQCNSLFFRPLWRLSPFDSLCRISAL